MEHKEDLYSFLHDKGYTFFTLPKLTLSEINLLLSVFNRKQKRKEKAYKKVSKRKR